MTTGELAGIIAGAVVILGAFAWIIASLGGLRRNISKDAKAVADLNHTYAGMAEEDIAHLFNKEFREELRNRGRIRFEQIIDENAMFLKQDLDLTGAQINEYIKKEITDRLNAEFATYAKAMKEAQELTLQTLQKTAQDVQAQHNQLSEALQKDVADRKAALIAMYEQNMAQVVEHYVLQTLSDQLDLKSQLPLIIKQMEANKQAIIEDMKL